MKVPVAEPDIGALEAKYVLNAIQSGWISSIGEYINRFEDLFAGFCGRRLGISTSNGTTALHLALAALGISQGNEVIVPTLTFVGSANTVKYCGARVRFVDSNERYWCLDPDCLETAITSDTKAIMVVHLYGHPCDMERILETARQHNLYVIEDCAEAHGAEYKGRRIGSFGDISCFSFYGNKIITTGEGGMCLTDNDELAEKMRVLRSHGMSPTRKYWHDVIGYNYRMTNLQAAVGVAQMEKIQQTIEKKRAIAATYNRVLDSLEGITLAPEEPWARSVYWMYSILVAPDLHLTRDELAAELGVQGIETRPFFFPIHTLPPYKESTRYPNAESLSERGLNLPSGNATSLATIAQVAEAVRSLVE